MAKKQQTSVTETAPKLRIAVGILGSAQSENLEDIRKIPFVHKVISGDHDEVISQLQKEDADLYLLTHRAAQVKNNYVQSLVKLASTHEKIDQHYFTVVEGANKSRMTELFSGFGKAEWDPAFIALGKVCFSRYASQGIIASNGFELAYLVEKTCCKNEVIEADKKEIAKPGILSGLGKKLRTSLKFYTGGGRKAIHKFLFLGFSAIAVILCMWLSRDAGISGDEFTQYEYSKLTANYYESLLGGDIKVDTVGLKGQKMATLVKKSYTDPANLATQEDPDRLMHLYGASFDTITTLMSRWFGIEDIMDFRHLMNALFGFLCMFFGALIVRRITGGSWKYAWLTLIVLFCTPRLLGESFNNPKDVPFAAGYVMAIYYTLKSFSNLYVIRFSSFLGLVFSVALGISIRIGGLLSIAIFIMFAGLQYINKIGQKNFLAFRWQGFGKLLVPVVVVALASYLLGIFIWPYGWDDPITNPIRAFKSFSNYGGSIRQLFEGKLWDSDMLPSHYLAKYILITTPIALLIGLLANALFPAWKKTKFDLNFFLVFFAAIFPVLFIFIQKSQVYGGLRHILFTIPMFVICGIIGYYLIEQWLSEKKWAAYAIPSFLLALTALPASFIAKNHPLEYIYFNELVGGTAGAYGKYEMDYYLAGLRPSTEWFLENVARKNPKKRYQILTYGMDQVRYYCRKDTNVHVGFTRYDERGEVKWDYAIFYNAYMDRSRLLGGKYPPVGTVYSPTVAGKPMGIVIKRPSLADYEGFRADRAGNNRLAVDKYNEYLKVDSNSNEVYLYLAYAYSNLGAQPTIQYVSTIEDNDARMKLNQLFSEASRSQTFLTALESAQSQYPQYRDKFSELKKHYLTMLDSTIWAAKKSVEIYPEYTKSLYALNQFYTEKNDLDNAIKVIDQYLEARPQEADAHLVKAQTQARKGDLRGASESVQNSIRYNPFDVRNYQMGTQIYSGLKDNANASQYNDAAGLFNAKDAAAYEKGMIAIKEIYFGITGKELDTKKLTGE